MDLIQVKRVQSKGDLKFTMERIEEMQLNYGEPLLFSYIDDGNVRWAIAVGTVGSSERNFKLYPIFSDQDDFADYVKQSLGEIDNNLSEKISNLSVRIDSLEKLDDVTEDSGLELRGDSLAVRISSEKGNLIKNTREGLFVSIPEELTTQISSLAISIQSKVDSKTTINGHSLESDITLTAEDIKTTEQIGTSIIGSSLQVVLKNLSDSINTSVSGGITSISTGNGLSVDVSGGVNNPKISVKIAEGSALTATEDGLDIVWAENK